MSTITFAILSIVTVLLGVRPVHAADSQAASSAVPPNQAPASRVPENQPASGRDKDDLSWLIGQWRCVTKEVRTSSFRPTGSVTEDGLEYFNVYLPYADDRLTLELTDDPRDRPIAAEFLARQVSYSPFEERLIPMQPWGPVRIGRNMIFVGNPDETLKFRYRTEERGGCRWLILESTLMKLGLIRMSTQPGSLVRSSVMAPVKSYPTAKLSELARAYQRLGEGITGQRGAANSPNAKTEKEKGRGQAKGSRTLDGLRRLDQGSGGEVPRP